MADPPDQGVDHKTVELMVLRTFQREVQKQCEHAMMSVVNLNSALAILHSDQSREAPRHIWYAIHSFLIAAANISKLLWDDHVGDPKKRKVRRNRRQRLRNSLGIPNNSILKLSPEFRGYFEHMDERIEEWAEESDRHNMAEDTIGPIDAIRGLDPGDMFRQYDPATHRLYFRGNRFDIQPVVSAIEELLAVAQREASKPHWEEPEPPDMARDSREESPDPTGHSETNEQPPADPKGRPKPLVFLKYLFNLFSGAPLSVQLSRRR